MKVAWTHTFADTEISSGVFMYLLADAIVEKGVNTDLLNIRKDLSIFSILGNQRKLNELLGKYDIIHSQYGSGCGYVTSKVQGKKILTLRGSDWYGFCAKNFKEHIRSFLSRKMTLASLCKYDAVIVVSERMKREVESYTNLPIYVLPSGIDLQKFYEIDKYEARRSLGCGEDGRPWILFSSVSENNPLKRFELAEASIQEVQKKFPDAVMKIVHGVPHDLVPTLINASDVILLTSTHEGWPNIIKEGLACNVPFVSTDVSDLSCISKSEDSCFVTLPTPIALAECIISSLLLDRPRNLKKYVLNMEKGKIADKIIDIYKCTF